MCVREESGLVDEYPFSGALLMLGRHTAMQSEYLFDGRLHAALEAASRFRAAGLEVREEVSFADEISELVVGLPESVMGVPPAFPGG